MKKARMLVLLLLLFAIPITAQEEQAPTLAKCRADADSWGVPRPQLTDIWSQDTSHDAKVLSVMLNARRGELQDCMKADKAQFARYLNAEDNYSEAEMTRLFDFIQRHNLYFQFYQEDEQGKR